ncbi:MAG: hypothetical protein H0U63_04605 [Burkholderiales bacterium]|nr:hypothetical protein [Burkholderiales bacterium]
MKERKTAQVITKITQPDREWLDRECERQGICTSAFLRMAIRREREAQNQRRD